MHKLAYRYIQSHAHDRAFAHILEIGSLDVNSSEQGLNLYTLFPGAQYTGIDVADGPGVDVVCSAADYDGKGTYDLVISTEAMEHTPRPEDIIECAWRALEDGGVLLITAAGPGRERHNCDGTAYSGVEHYANITPDQLGAWLAGWQDVEVIHSPNAGDVYACATKPRSKRNLSIQGSDLLAVAAQ